MSDITAPAAPLTLLEKIWHAHVVERLDDETDLLYIDRHLVQEVSSPQAFDTLREQGLPVRRPDATLGVADHAVPTLHRERPVTDPLLAEQLAALSANCADFGIKLFDLHHASQGIVHVIGPELGLTLPGTTLVCGDSHTSTHGGLGALAFGIGTSEVAHVLATQTLQQRRPRSMRVTVVGALSPSCSAKDLALHVGGVLGPDGGTGHVIEYAGDAITALSVEERLTLCNMSIELGARAAIVAPDATVFAYLQGKPYAPSGEAWDRAMASWRELFSDPGAVFDKSCTIDAADIAPSVTWGTSPAEMVPISGAVPDPASTADAGHRAALQRSLDYMGLVPGTAMRDIAIDVVFIGSCTNSRLSDLRLAAEVARGRKVAPGVRAIVVPGSGTVKRLAEAEHLDEILVAAGFEWRDAGCSMCVAMNDDRLAPGERCVSTSNRNFEGRQGPGGRTHLASPATAAASALEGRIADPRPYLAGSERR
jgi:3-isopropylmalate/(R)-2-methylmalate dehydratase large subunit